MSPELELIDQLEGGDLPLAVVLRLGFRDRDHASHVLQIYMTKGILVLTKLVGSEIEEVPAQTAAIALHNEATWQEDSGYKVKLTEAGLRRFQDGTWKNI